MLLSLFQCEKVQADADASSVGWSRLGLVGNLAIVLWTLGLPLCLLSVNGINIPFLFYEEKEPRVSKLSIPHNIGDYYLKCK